LTGNSPFVTAAVPQLVPGHTVKFGHFRSLNAWIHARRVACGIALNLCLIRDSQLTTPVILSTAIAAAVAVAIAAATKIYGATSGTIRGASVTTGATIISNSPSHYNHGVK